MSKHSWILFVILSIASGNCYSSDDSNWTFSHKLVRSNESDDDTDFSIELHHKQSLMAQSFIVTNSSHIESVYCKGDLINVIATRSGGNRGYKIVSYDAKRAQTINEIMTQSRPSVSPDGNRIAYIRWIRRFSRETYNNVLMILDSTTNSVIPVFPDENRQTGLDLVADSDNSCINLIQADLLWKRDGSGIVFVLNKRSIGFSFWGDMFLVNLDFSIGLENAKAAYHQIDVESLLVDSVLNPDRQMAVNSINWVNESRVLLMLKSDFFWKTNLVEMEIPSLPSHSGTTPKL